MKFNSIDYQQLFVFDFDFKLARKLCTYIPRYSFSFHDSMSGETGNEMEGSKYSINNDDSARLTNR